MSESPFMPDTGPGTRLTGFKAMPGNGRIAVGVLWFYGGALAIGFVISVWATVPDLASSGWSTRAARGFGFASVFAGLALAHGFLAMGLVRRRRLARLGAVVLELAVIVGYLYLAVHSVVTDFLGSLEDLGGLLCGVAFAAAVAIHLSSSEMRAWCDR